MSSSGQCGKDINSGFLFDAADEIMSIASINISIEALKLEISVFNESCYEQIVDAVKEILTNHSLAHIKKCFFSVVGYFIDEKSENSCFSSDSEDDIDLSKYHGNIGYSSGHDVAWMFCNFLTLH